jgi:hypothetical protein
MKTPPEQAKDGTEKKADFQTLMWAVVGLAILWFLLLVVVCVLRAEPELPSWAWWLWRPRGSVWNLLLLAPGGVAAGGLVGFVLGSYGEERRQFSEWAKTLSTLAGGASAADVLRGPESYLVLAFASIARVCGSGTSAGLVFVVLLGFFGLGFLAMYTVKMAFLNPLAMRTSPELITGADAEKLEKEGIAGKPGAQEKAEAAVGAPFKLLTAAASRPVPLPTEPLRAKLGQESALLNGSGGDIQKGKWGGKSVSGGYILLASVTATDKSEAYFRVRIWVQSVEPSVVLTGKVTFHLHDTFKQPDVVVAATDGIAEIERLAWGAFTVGAELGDGVTLELDLSELPGAPRAFRER